MIAYRKLLVSFVTLALVAANAASDYTLNVTQPIQVGGTELKPGKYKIELQGDKAVFKAGKDIVAQASVTVETVKQNYFDTGLGIKDSKLQTVSIGGTKLRIVLKQ